MNLRIGKSMTLQSVKRSVLLLSLLGLSLQASAQTLVEDAWVRATVPGQPSTGAFMRITASSDSMLVDATSTAAKTVQIHQSTMKNDIMSMTPVASVPLPAGKVVAIQPSGYHVMLIDLKKQVKAGDEVPITLTVENAQGEQETIDVVAKGRALNAGDDDGM
ncbi:copper chaperone PCu(A)C [Pseudomonas sp. NA-150]|uniref:copper chaperone PCu(A)C n=1 Tax=Pseudomonas sp. NA-150 TaxID=3367525 RepID=UPI0037CBD0EA